MYLSVVLLALVSFTCADFDPADTTHAKNSLLARYIYEQHNVQDITPEVRAKVSDVEYDLYTPSNRLLRHLIQNGNVNSLSGSHFDPSRLSVFVVHGWTQGRSSELNLLLRDALFDNYNVNVFIVDWSDLASKLYTTSAASVVSVGQIIGNFINGIQSAYGVDGSNFVLIGHSLGAHVVGSAGATVTRKVQNIIGLDPAGPLFQLVSTDRRLDPTDGQYVQVIHSDGEALGLGLGLAESIGHVDYFPNGGDDQPGCELDLTGMCDHMRCDKYLAEAIKRGASAFRSRKCSTYTAYKLGWCITNEQSNMGEIIVTSRTSGDFYLDTNRFSPYGQS